MLFPVHEEAERAAGRPLSAFDALLFDLDGTLADTMSLHFRAYAEALRQWGGTLVRTDFDAVVGGSASQTVPHFIARARITGPLPAPQEVHASKKQALHRLLADAPPLPLAAAALVEHCRATHKLGVVTSGNRDGAQALLGRLFGSPSPFGVIVTGDDVTRGKPDPAPYLLAAERLDVAPASCLVLEDHPAGITAAIAAGMDVVDVTAWSA